MTHILSFHTKMRFPALSNNVLTLLKPSKESAIATKSNIHKHLMCKRCLSVGGFQENSVLANKHNVKNYNSLYINKPVKEIPFHHKRYLPRASCEFLAVGGDGSGYRQQIRGLKGGRDKVGMTVDDRINPIDKLQSFVVKPIIAPEEYVFKPTVDDISQAQEMFLPGPDNKIEFLKSALMEEHLPEYELPEVAFIGRSNVGKSSLISMLLSHTDVLVRTSKKPGHTRLLNFFQIGNHFTLVDMPGYGFNMPAHYSASVEAFLSSRRKLSRTFLLVDGTIGVTKEDVIGLNMLEEFGLPYVIVLTKIDKAKPALLLKSFMTVLQYRNQTAHCFPQPFLVSSINGEGVPVLQSFIAYVTGNLAVKGM